MAASTELNATTFVALEVLYIQVVPCKRPVRGFGLGCRTWRRAIIETIRPKTDLLLSSDHFERLAGEDGTLMLISFDPPSAKRKTSVCIAQN